MKERIHSRDGGEDAIIPPTPSRAVMSARF